MPTDDNDMKRAAHNTLVSRVLDGAGTAPRGQRRAAFDNAGLDEPLSTLVDKVALRPTRVTDEDFAAVQATGLSEDQVFELVICAALGQATRQYETAFAALAEASTGRDVQDLPDQANETDTAAEAEGSGHAARNPQ
ncbi:MAG TPA: hypothetical protein VGP82_02685 [Ktedonobacterales bacterium]|jgi:hypothetical protein|nr:hypothetical protein [Ktedonobacterales bacterium]